ERQQIKESTEGGRALPNIGHCQSLNGMQGKDQSHPQGQNLLGDFAPETDRGGGRTDFGATLEKETEAIHQTGIAEVNEKINQMIGENAGAEGVIIQGQG